MSERVPPVGSPLRHDRCRRGGRRAAPRSPPDFVSVVGAARRGALAERYFADYADEAQAACERSAKFSLRNFALHFVASNASLTGPYNLSHWYGAVRAQPSRVDALDGRFLQAGRVARCFFLLPPPRPACPVGG